MRLRNDFCLLTHCFSRPDTAIIINCSSPTRVFRYHYRLSCFFLPWPVIQTSMRLRLGRTTSPPRTTLTVLHSPQLHLRPPHRSSPWMLLHLRAPSRPRSVGRARHGTARMKMRTSTFRAVTSHEKVLQAHRTKKKSSLHHTRLLDHDLSYVLKPLLRSPDSTRGEHSVSTHTSLKMERFHHHALDHHHLWCDKVKEKRILSTVLLVS